MFMKLVTSYLKIYDEIPSQVQHDPQLYNVLKHWASLDSYCNYKCGFMPCTVTVSGNIFIILMYGCFMFFEANFKKDEIQQFSYKFQGSS